MLAAAWLCTLPTAVLPQSEPAGWQAVIEQVVVLDAPAPGDPAPRGKDRTLELSALAWDAPAQVLVAASDRGRLYRYRLGSTGGPLQPQPVSTQRLERGAGGVRPNVEGLAWRPTAEGGELLLAEEMGSAVQRRAADGALLGTLPWPAAVADALAARSAGQAAHGVEAIGHHPRHGLLAALQRPLRLTVAQRQRAPVDADGAPARAAHWVHAADGARWGFLTAGPRSQLKALEVMADGSLLLLERVQQARDAPLRAVLRRLDPQQCDSSRLCEAPALQQRPAALVGLDNFEGLACAPAPEGPCWMVSDDGGGDRPTQLVQFRLARP